MAPARAAASAAAGSRSTSRTLTTARPRVAPSPRRLTVSASLQQNQQQIPGGDAASSRRAALLSLAAAAALVVVPANEAAANPLEDATRAVLRPADALTDEQAVAALLDARNTLKDVAELASTPLDSRERFEGRKLWPAFARWLRPAGPAAPRVVALALGGKDVEATLSSRYGGAAGPDAAAAAADAAAVSSSASLPLGDELYRSLGAVLTISGRTIREEAQASPERALRAAAAIDGVLERVPQDVKDGAQRLRVAARAARGK